MPTASGPTATIRSTPAAAASRPSRSCSARRVGPELGHRAEDGDPPLARQAGERGQRGPHRLGVGVVGVVDDGDAVGAPGRPPCASGCAARRPTGRRPRAAGRHARPRARRRRPTARWRPGARPTTCRATGCVSPAAVQREAGAGRARRATTSVARTSASAPAAGGDHPGPGARAAMPSTRGSSALRTAVPSSGSASTSSPLAPAMPSGLPNSPRWAEPTLSTTPTCGRATRAQPGDVPRAAGAHLQHEEAGVLVGVEHGERQADVVVVRAGRADGRTGGGEHLAEEVLGRGLAGGAGDAQRAAGPPAVSRAWTPAASRPRAATGSSTTTQGSASSGRVVRAATAPAAAAAPRKSWPSTRSPAHRDEEVAGRRRCGSRA